MAGGVNITKDAYSIIKQTVEANKKEEQKKNAKDGKENNEKTIPYVTVQ